MIEPNRKKVLITGAANGIGLCLAKEFARVGCKVVLADIDSAALDKAAEKIGRTKGVVSLLFLDVTDPWLVNEEVGGIADSEGIDILVNNAGIGHSGELADTEPGTWKRLMDVNFWGPLNMIHAVLPHMRKNGGQIVNVSSGQAFFRLPTWGAYATTKAALGTFSEILHFELAKYGISVTTVYPFMVNTGFYKGIGGETLLGKLSMRLVPYYSMSPQKVARIIFEATWNRKAVERVCLLNELMFRAQCLPVVPWLVATLGNLFLTRRAGR